MNDCLSDALVRGSPTCQVSAIVYITLVNHPTYYLHAVSLKSIGDIKTHAMWE